MMKLKCVTKSMDIYAESLVIFGVVKSYHTTFLTIKFQMIYCIPHQPDGDFPRDDSQLRHVEVVAAEASPGRLPLHSQSSPAKYRHPEEDIEDWSQHCPSYEALDSPALGDFRNEHAHEW